MLTTYVVNWMHHIIVGIPDLAQDKFRKYLTILKTNNYQFKDSCFYWHILTERDGELSAINLYIT